MKICLVGHSANALRGTGTGGSEKQIALLARHLARRGHEVTFVVAGESDGSGMVDSVRVLSGWEVNRGFWGVRLLTYRWPRMKQVLSRVDADIYYMRGISFYTLLVPAVARSRKALCLFGMTNDGDLEACAGRAFFDMGSSFLSSAVGPLIQTYFLRHILPGMDWIIVQNMAQAARCQELDIPYHIIPSIVEPPPVELLHLPEEVDVVWVGNIISDTRRSKGVTELVALIRLLPHIQFEIIGELSAPGIQPILNELKQYSNVRLIGRLSYYETLAKIAQSRLVINTSPQEGFSNVMLEAWSLGKPTITLHVNPDKLLRNNGLGACAQGNLKKMSMMISDLLDDRRKLKAMNEECREYIEKTHFPEIVCRSFENMIGG